MASLGQDLKRERELRAISLQDMAEQTKINIRFLRALEEDKLDVLPGGFFVKAMLRSYSKCLGIDEGSVLNKYQEDLFLEQEADTADKPKIEVLLSIPKRNDAPEKILRSERKPRVKDRRNRLFWTLAGIATLCVAAVLTAVYFFFLRPRPAARPASKPPVVAPAENPAAPAGRPAVVASPPAAASEMRLELTFTAETWIQVAADGDVRIDGMYQPGATVSCAARREFVLQTGNAGGFDFRVDGRPGKPLGTSGAVRTNVRIARDTLEQFLR
jgi:cytoskeletal protein RodZ